MSKVEICHRTKKKKLAYDDFKLQPEDFDEIN